MMKTSILAIVFCALYSLGFGHEISHVLFEESGEADRSGVIIQISTERGTALFRAEVDNGELRIVRSSQEGDVPDCYVAITDQQLSVWVGKDSKSFSFLQYSVEPSGEIKLDAEAKVQPKDEADHLRIRMQSLIDRKKSDLALLEAIKE
jgi:hypothetical protein